MRVLSGSFKERWVLNRQRGMAEGPLRQRGTELARTSLEIRGLLSVSETYVRRHIGEPREHTEKSVGDSEG